MKLYLILSYEVVLGPHTLEGIKTLLQEGKIDNSSAVLCPEKMNWLALAKFLQTELNPQEAQTLLYDGGSHFDSLEAFRILNILPPKTGPNEKTTFIDLNKSLPVLNENTRVVNTFEEDPDTALFTLDQFHSPATDQHTPNTKTLEKKSPRFGDTVFQILLIIGFLGMASGIYWLQKPVARISKPKDSASVMGLKNLYQYLSRVHFKDPNVNGAYLVGLNLIYGYDYEKAAEYYSSPQIQKLIKESFASSDRSHQEQHSAWHFEWHKALLLTYAQRDYLQSNQLIDQIMTNPDNELDEVGKELLLNLKGVNLFFSGDLKSSLEHFEKVALQFPQSGLVKFNLLRVALEYGNDKIPNESSWESTLKQNMDDKDDLQFLSLYLLNTSTVTTQTQAYLKQIEEADPFSLLPHYIKAKNALAKGEYMGAFEALAPGLLVPNEYFTQVRENPFYLAIYPKKILKMSAELINQLKGKVPAVDLELLTFRIEDLLQQSSKEEISKIYTSLSSPLYEKNPNISFYRMWLAEAFLQQNLPDQALTILNMVSDQWRKSEYFLILMGRTYNDLKQSKQARVFFQESIRVASSPAGFYWLGTLLASQGVKLAADQALWMSLERHPGFWLPRKVLAERLQLLGHIN